MSTTFDVTTTDVRITQAQNTRLDLQNQLRNQQVQLARLLHKPTPADVPVKGRLTYEPAARGPGRRGGQSQRTTAPK